MTRPVKISLFILLVILIVYPVSYLSLRERETLKSGGYWVIYFYQNTYVSQYAIDQRARRQFNYSVTNGDRSFLAGNDGAIGKNWFCVYRKPHSRIFRIYKLAEHIENWLTEAG